MLLKKPCIQTPVDASVCLSTCLPQRVPALTNGATEVNWRDPNSPAALLARELALRVGRPPAARRRAGLACSVAVVAHFGGGWGGVWVLDDPGQRSCTCSLLGPFHDEDGARLQNTKGDEG